MEGSNRKCGWEICCQAEFGEAKNEDEKARKYGELTCDIPFVTAVEQMKALAKWSKENEEKIDMIIWTGDSVSHDIHRIS
jgi:hypothetical protein